MGTVVPFSMDTLLPQLQPWSAYMAVSCLFGSYLICLAIYRLFLSPLAAFPGPKLAAVTSWYEIYFSVIKPAKFAFEVERMHQIYGPIVRVNPYELSVNDGDFYNKVYVAGSVRRTEGYNPFFEGINFEDTHLLTSDHDLHRRRRKPIEAFFSRKGVANLQPLLVEMSRKLADRLHALKGTGNVIRLDHAHVAYTTDIITRICFDKYPNYLDDPDFGAHWFGLIRGLVQALPIFSAFPYLIKILGFIPGVVLTWALPHSSSLILLEKVARESVANAINENKNSDGTETNSLFRHILQSDMPESELTADRLAKEAQVLLPAGSFTVARALDFTAVYILLRPHIHARLRTELKDFAVEELEKLPYLQAVIKEGLRLTYGTMHRLPRISPDVALQYKNWNIPPGVPVGMSAYLMHRDPDVYDRPLEFIPERWLGDINPLMNRNFVPFTKGSRNCLGMSLAYAEIRLSLAVMFCPGAPELELSETDESDVIPVYDLLGPLPHRASKGVRVRVL